MNRLISQDYTGLDINQSILGWLFMTYSYSSSFFFMYPKVFLPLNSVVGGSTSLNEMLTLK